MATRACCADGNFTTAATWALIDSTSFSRAQTNVTTVTTSYVESSSFTPGAITIDGIAVMIGDRLGTTGTLTVRLAQAGSTVAGTETSVNTADLPACSHTNQGTTPVAIGEGGWFFFKFAAPVTLAAATAYTLSAKTSSSSQVTLERDGTAANWSRYLRTTTTGAPGAGDDLIITKEWTAASTGTARTVTMDSTATTDYGSNTTNQITPALAITQGGTLTFGTTAATNYRLRLSGYMIVYNGGTFNMGSSGAEIPRDSTAQLQFDCAASGDFGLVCRNGSTVRMYGLSRTSAKNFTFSRLAADLAASGTSATLDDDTGWKNGDTIGFASTNRPTTGSATTQAETKAMSADASGTSISFAAVANAHSGTSPTKGHVILLTRNVGVHTVTATRYTFVYVGVSTVFAASWVEFNGVGANALSKSGVTSNTTAGSSGSTLVEYCSFHDIGGAAVELSGSGTVQYTVAYDSVICHFRTNASSETWTIDHCVGLLARSRGCYELNDIGGTVTNCIAASGVTNASNNPGFRFAEGATIGTFQNNEAYSTAANAMDHLTGCVGTIENFIGWYAAGVSTTSGGIRIVADTGDSSTVGVNSFLKFLTCTLFGNTNSNFFMDAQIHFEPIIFDNCTFSGTTTNATTHGININTNARLHGGLFLQNCDFSTATGIKTAHTNDFNIIGNALVWGWADNCKMGGTNIFVGHANLFSDYDDRFNFGFQRLQQVDGGHRVYKRFGALIANASTFNTAAPSEEMQPNNASNKLRSSRILVAANDGETKSVTVYARKSAAYNGNAPRLILKRQDSMGIAADIVADTLSVGADTWEQLSYTTAAALETGVFEFILDCDGTAGSAFLDDVAVA